MMRTILAVDDDRDIVHLIREGFRYESSFEVIPAYTGEEALKIVDSHSVDFVILDIMLPGLDGMETCRRIRQQHTVPILLLSARDRELDKVIGLEIGADDYLTKPFSPRELLARVKAHFRRVERMKREMGPYTRSGPLSINEQTYEVFMDGEKVDLSAKEFQILSFLAKHPNQVLSREQLYQKIWGQEFGDLNTVTVHIKNIRKKLGRDCIKTIWGVGYKFAWESEEG
ncbi:response regulator transcription factor [Kroppenstedtia eburnea]|uniref:response regulator transcription factor n=1 Tax=Kroppenstedtia eburnea TaxID=714067 RepID=UPI0036392F66